MSNETKEAIQQAQKTLETDRKEQLQREVYGYLKQELDAIDAIDNKVRQLSTEKRAHEENIKNVKQGNLEAIEKRRLAFNWPATLSGTNGTVSHPSASGFYYTYVAGTTVTSSSGKTYIF